MSHQFDIRLPERKPLPRIVVPPVPEPPTARPAPPPVAPMIPATPKRPNKQRALNLRGRQKATVCKVCSQPRYDGCTNALCYAHYLEWHQAYQRDYHRKRRAKAGQP